MAALPPPPTRKEKGPIERRAHVLSKVRGAEPRRRQVLRGVRLAAARRGSPGRKRSGGVAPQPGSQSAPTYQTPVTIPDPAAQPVPHRQPRHPKPLRSKKPLVIGIAVAVVAVIAAVVVLVVLPAVNPKPFEGTLALTKDEGSYSYNPLHLDLKGGSARVDGSAVLGSSAGEQDVRVIRTERRGDVMVYDLDPSSSEYWQSLGADQSLQAFAPVGASAEKPYGRWGFVFYANTGAPYGPALVAVNLVLNEDGTGRYDYVHAETTANGSDAGSIDDLMWANPLSDGYDPAVLEERGNKYNDSATIDFAYAMDFTWMGDPAHMTIRIPNYRGPDYDKGYGEKELTLSIAESK